MISLSNILRINAISSGITGFLLVLQSSLSAALFGLESRLPFIGTGLFLLAFAAYVWYRSGPGLRNRRPVRVIIGIDSLWVLASLWVLFFFHARITAFGSLAIGIVALWVALMAYLQYQALQTAHRNAD